MSTYALNAECFGAMSVQIGCSAPLAVAKLDVSGDLVIAQASSPGTTRHWEDTFVPVLICDQDCLRRLTKRQRRRLCKTLRAIRMS